MGISKEELVRLQEEVARIREQRCSLCGFTRMRHETPPSEEWATDPAAFPCDEFQEKVA